jgi:hypothetical protein
MQRRGWVGDVTHESFRCQLHHPTQHAIVTIAIFIFIVQSESRVITVCICKHPTAILLTLVTLARPSIGTVANVQLGFSVGLSFVIFVWVQRLALAQRREDRVHWTKSATQDSERRKVETRVISALELLSNDVRDRSPCIIIWSTMQHATEACASVRANGLSSVRACRRVGYRTCLRVKDRSTEVRTIVAHMHAGRWVIALVGE